MTEALARIRAAGIELSVHNGKLAYRAPVGVMTPEMSAWLRRHKRELIELLADGPMQGAGPARERIGSCIWCRDAAYSDDAVPLPGGDALHMRCMAAEPSPQPAPEPAPEPEISQSRIEPAGPMQRAMARDILMGPRSALAASCAMVRLLRADGPRPTVRRESRRSRACSRSLVSRCS